MNLSDNARRLLRERYCRPNEEPKDLLIRTAETIGEVNNRTDEYREMILDLNFLCNSPALFNAGYSNQMKACYVIPIQDDIRSIFKAVADMAKIQKSGGGTGFNFSNLREKGASISGGGRSTGAISFMKIFDKTTDAIRQGGRRRGASIGILDYDHPEIVDFIKEKIANGTMQNFNLSMLVDDDFMEKVINDDRYILRTRKEGNIYTRMKARDVFKIAAYSAWLSGDPGLLFKDRINQDNNREEEIEATNPCGEVPLHPYNQCCLGSINLSQCVNDGDLMEDKIEEISRLGSQFLLDINEINEFTIEECYEAQEKYNSIGLGVMGFADLLMEMEIDYDSREALSVIDRIGKIMERVTKKTAPESQDRISIAPTGSLSIIADCSSGIEPIFSEEYIRDTRSGQYREMRDHPNLRTAHEVSPLWHLRIQAEWQKYADAGVSKTINMPNNASVEIVERMYKEAWRRGVKGITIFRDKSKENQVYNSCEGETCTL